MMNKTAIYSLALCTSINLLAADTNVEDEKRKRLPSVRDVIQSVHTVEPKEVDTVSGIRHMFEDGTVSGELRSMYSRYNFEEDENIYATAIGGQVQYELAKYKGFNAAVRFLTSHEVSDLSGDDKKFNPDLSSEDGSYTQMIESYINYEYDNFNIRVGRQSLDTPLADSDDVRMTPNTFEAYILSYNYNDFDFMAGYLNRFQGYDTGLDVDNPWQDTGEDGTYLASFAYETDELEGSLWYYDISEDENPNSTIGNVANKSVYLSLGGHYHFDNEAFLYMMTQYLNQSEESNSNVESRIYGVMSELVVSSIGFNLAYNYAEDMEGKKAFSGFGGGTLFTSMDDMVLENIASDRRAYAVVGGISWELSDFHFLCAYGIFRGDENTAGVTEHITESDIGFEYSTNESYSLSALYTKQSDKDNTNINGGDWENFRILVSYKF
jgi:hypothetical protein